MTNPEQPPLDPFLARLLRYRTGLKAGGPNDRYEVLATYHSRAGGRPFAICRTGLLLDPDREARFVLFSEIEDGGYYDLETLRRAKEAPPGVPSKALSIRLYTGEVIDLPLDVRDDGMPDLLPIAKLIHQRAVLHRSERRGVAAS